MSTLAEIRDGWDQAAQTDAMGHILTTGQPWDQAEFFRTGLVEIDAALERADFLGHRGAGRGLALDFGCGIGRLTQALAVHYDQVIGVDISPAMLAQARDLNLLGDRVSYCLQTPHGEYDLIYSNLVLQHMPRELSHEHVRRFIRLLADDGIAIFMIPEGPDYTHPTACLSMWGTPPDDVKRVVSDAGGRIVDMDTVPGPASQWAPWRYTARRLT